MTNEDGRTDQPLVARDGFVKGRYTLSFAIGDYFAVSGADPSNPPFLDIVSLEFGVADPSEHYHVPLLVSPFGYSTYRGS